MAKYGLLNSVPRGCSFSARYDLAFRNLVRPSYFNYPRVKCLSCLLFYIFYAQIDLCSSIQSRNESENRFEIQFS